MKKLISLSLSAMLALGGSAPVSDSDTIPPECVDCIRDCAWCTYNIADPETYHRR